ncbi:MAG: hypothetical protein HY791_21320 [Deltaproteobacteria bacterium]|nr:hypothetical protein [Deltaproteobacteria bacterium]
MTRISSWEPRIAVGRASKSAEWVPDANACEGSAVLEILAQQSIASGGRGRTKNECVPERKAVQSVEIDRVNDVVGLDADNVHYAEPVSSWTRNGGR